MIDAYSKAVLTVIAVALVALVAQRATHDAQAMNGCGSRDNPCYVATGLLTPFIVSIR